MFASSGSPICKKLMVSRKIWGRVNTVFKLFAISSPYSPLTHLSAKDHAVYYRKLSNKPDLFKFNSVTSKFSCKILLQIHCSNNEGLLHNDSATCLSKISIKLSAGSAISIIFGDK